MLSNGNKCIYSAQYQTPNTPFLKTTFRLKLTLQKIFIQPLFEVLWNWSLLQLSLGPTSAMKPTKIFFTPVSSPIPLVGILHISEFGLQLPWTWILHMILTLSVHVVGMMFNFLLRYEEESLFLASNHIDDYASSLFVSNCTLSNFFRRLLCPYLLV